MESPAIFPEFGYILNVLMKSSSFSMKDYRSVAGALCTYILSQLSSLLMETTIYDALKLQLLAQANKTGSAALNDDTKGTTFLCGGNKFAFFVNNPLK